MKKLLTSSKVFSNETIAALNDATLTVAQAVARACMEGAKIDIQRDKFVEELRKVSNIPCGTNSASAGLRAAKMEGATLESVSKAIADQYEKDRVAAQERRKAQKKRVQNKDKGENEGEDKDEDENEKPTPKNDTLTLAQLEAKRELLKKELKEIEGLIASMRAAAPAPAMGDAAVGGC